MSRIIKLASWNVNSIRIRLDNLRQFIEDENPDIICIQEVKAKEEDFPFDDINLLGFDHIALYGMAGYNGVAILSKLPLEDIEKKDWVGKSDARHIRARFKDIDLNNIYIPAGGDIPDPVINLSFAHKLTFMDDISEYFEKNQLRYKDENMIICGDFNVAPLENDVWSHKQMLKFVSHTPVEIERINRLKASLSFVDILREFYKEPEKLYSWWSYRNPNWQTNDKGRRLDHIWVSPSLKDRVKSAKIYKDARYQTRPSDHVPVIIEIEA